MGLRFSMKVPSSSIVICSTIEVGQYSAAIKKDAASAGSGSIHS